MREAARAMIVKIKERLTNCQVKPVLTGSSLTEFFLQLVHNAVDDQGHLAENVHYVSPTQVYYDLCEVSPNTVFDLEEAHEEIQILNRQLRGTLQLRLNGDDYPQHHYLEIHYANQYHIKPRP